MIGAADAVEDGPYRVLLRAMRRHCDPFRDDCWCRGRPITRAEVAAAIREGRLERRENDQRLRDRMSRAETLVFDAERVAYLTVHPATDPVCIDVIGTHEIRVEDGCHRIAAAIMRREPELLVSYSGIVSVFQRAFRRRALQPRSANRSANGQVFQGFAPRPPVPATA